MSSIATITIEAEAPSAARDFYAAAFGEDLPIDVVPAGAPTDGFRGFTVSLIVKQPADADLLLTAAADAGATTLKPAAKSIWGYGGVVQAPDGTIVKVATQSKKDTQPASRTIEDVVVLLGVEDVGASKRFYTDHGFTVGKSIPRTYVEFEAPAGTVKLGLYKRRALAKDAGVPREGSGSHRVAFTTPAADRSGAFTDPDGFTWAPARTPAAVA